MSANIGVLISATEVRRSALERLAAVLREQIVRSDGNATTRRDPPEILRVRTDRDLAAWIRDLATQWVDIDGLQAGSWDIVDGAVTDLLRAHDINRIREVLFDTLDRIGAGGVLPEPADTGYFIASITSSDATLETAHPPQQNEALQSQVEREKTELDFLSSVMEMCASQRQSSEKSHTEADVFALEHAYSVLDLHGRLPAAYSFIRTDELRPYQTYLSFADPGDGHLAITVRDSKLLQGLIVHIEHIDRENVPDKNVVEAYRMPPLRTAARVRLHVGLETPCTAFVGRPVLEGGNYKLGRLKAVHTIASACSSMFALGISECKLAMDSLTASEAVDFMQTVAGNVQRDHERQRLSAAFNINTPLVDDRKAHTTPITLKDKIDIADLAIELTAHGHFNKVAWDGAAEGPSKPILGDQLSAQQLLKLVHHAHERGLETYISAGMHPEHMYGSCLVGVGGVGIGLKLHYLDPITNRPGPIKPELVMAALEYRNQAAETIAGRAACELARLDWDFSRGLLPKPANHLRKELFETLLAWHSDANPAAWSRQAKPEIQKDHALTGPLEQRLSDLLARVAAEYPRLPLPSNVPPVGVPRGSQSLVPDNSITVDPLHLSAERVISNAGSEERSSQFSKATVQEIEKARNANDRDQLRRLLIGYQ